MNEVSQCKPRHGTGGLNVFIASGGWLGSFPGRGRIVATLNAQIDEFLQWRDTLVDAARLHQGNGTGSAHHATFFLAGRLVGGGIFYGTDREVVAQIVEHWTEHAPGCWDFRFNLRETIIDGAPINSEWARRIQMGLAGERGTE